MHHLWFFRSFAKNQTFLIRQKELQSVDMIDFIAWHCTDACLFETLNDYFRLHVCLFFRPFICHTLRFPIPAVVSQNVTNKSYFLCLESNKYICILGYLQTLWVYEARQSWATYVHDDSRQSIADVIKFTPAFHHFPSVGPSWVFALAHLGWTRKVGTS